MSEDWYRHWFGENYLRVYYHRDVEEAGHLVTSLCDRLRLPPGALVVDVACGPGRHALSFAQRGYRVLGVDLSMPLLGRALEVCQAERGETEGPIVMLARADMRALPIRTGGADLVVNLFSAFGYFPDEEDDALALQEMGRSLKPGGRFVLDFMNRRRLEKDLVPESVEYREGLHIKQQRRLIDMDRRIEKTITLEYADGRVESHRESVRLYAPDDLDRLARVAGLEPVEWLGDYDGAPFWDESPRCILVAMRPHS